MTSPHADPSPEWDAADRAHQAKLTFDIQLDVYLVAARRCANAHRHLPPEATSVDLAAFLTEEINEHSDLDYALGVLTSALVHIVGQEGPR